MVRAVLDATLDELSAVGFLALSVERVAERAGVNKTTIYRRYPTKIDLTAAALLDRKQAAFSLPDTGNLRDDLVALLVQGGTFMSEPRGKGLFRIMMSDRADPEVAQLAQRLRREGEQSPRIVLQRAIARGELAAETDMGLLLHTLFGPLIHRIFIDGEPFHPHEAEKIADIVLYGVALSRPREPRRRPR